MIVFVDRNDSQTLTPDLVRRSLDHPSNISIYYWPPKGVVYPHRILDSKEKFGNAQRYKIMAGFVHIPAFHVETPYWLKLDTDVVALGENDWVDPDWFVNNPYIIGHRWGFTKPPNSIQLLDDWSHHELLQGVLTTPTLDIPLDNPDSERISHSRISSWCAFFNTDFTVTASTLAYKTCGEGMLPVPSQDTYLWYLAQRLDPSRIVKENMKTKGFNYRSSPGRVYEMVKQSLGVADV